jgi:hypothetical protein
VAGVIVEGMTVIEDILDNKGEIATVAFALHPNTRNNNGLTEIRAFVGFARTQEGFITWLPVHTEWFDEETTV